MNKNLCLEHNLTQFDDVYPSDYYLKLFHRNVRSLSRNHVNLEALINYLNIDFDIIALTETWKTLSDFSNLFDGYKYYHNDNTSLVSSGCIFLLEKQLSIGNYLTISFMDVTI